MTRRAMPARSCRHCMARPVERAIQQGDFVLAAQVEFESKFESGSSQFSCTGVMAKVQVPPYARGSISLLSLTIQLQALELHWESDSKNERGGQQPREEGSSLCVRDCLTVALVFAAAAAPRSRSIMVRVSAVSCLTEPHVHGSFTLHHRQSVHCIHLENIAI